MNTSKVEESATSNATRPAEVFDSCLTVNELSLYYGDSKALSDINLDIATKKVTAFIGPSGCGKSTLLRCFNRMNDLIDDEFFPDYNEKRSAGESVLYLVPLSYVTKCIWFGRCALCHKWFLLLPGSV